MFSALVRFRWLRIISSVSVCAVCLASSPLLAQSPQLPTDDALKTPVAFPRFPAVEPEDAEATFVVQDGFQMQLVAAEPLVTDPVAMTIDEDGRAYVVEMNDYPYTDPKTHTAWGPRIRPMRQSAACVCSRIPTEMARTIAAPCLPISFRGRAECCVIEVESLSLRRPTFGT